MPTPRVPHAVTPHVKDIYLPSPSWGNHQHIFKTAGESETLVGSLLIGPLAHWLIATVESLSRGRFPWLCSLRLTHQGPTWGGRGAGVGRSKHNQEQSAVEQTTPTYPPPTTMKK